MFAWLQGDRVQVDAAHSGTQSEGPPPAPLQSLNPSFTPPDPELLRGPLPTCQLHGVAQRTLPLLRLGPLLSSFLHLLLKVNTMASGFLTSPRSSFNQ